MKSMNFFYCLHQLQWFLFGVFKDYLCPWLVSVMLVFVQSPLVVKPISIFIIVIPVLKAIISLVKPVIVLVPSVSVVVSVEVLSVLVVLARAPIVVSEM